MFEFLNMTREFSKKFVSETLLPFKNQALTKLWFPFYMFQNRGKSICLDRSGDIHLRDTQAAPSSTCEMIILRNNSRELQEFVWEYLQPLQGI